MLSIVKENIITFTRLPYSICSGYELVTIENINGEEVQSREIIENPKVQMLISERMELEYNSKKRWELPKYAIATSTDSLIVWINNVEMDIRSYTYSPNLKMLTIVEDISENDLIEIEYSVDRIEIKKKTSNEVKFKVCPIFNDSHKIGQHVII